jgi:hypothetical protein
LVTFIGFWAFDGLNSYLTFFPGAPHLYEPQNWLRLTTGLLNGLALVTFVFPIFNFTVWQNTTPARALENGRELLAVLPFVGLLVIAIQTGITPVLYLLAILSSLGVVLILALINSMLAAVVLGREGLARKRRQAAVPLVVGTALAILQMTGMVLLRAYFTTRLGLPF